MQPSQINDLVRDTEKTMSALAKNKGLDLTISLDADLPQAEFDRDKITQVLTNLVNNALKFTETGSIRIITKRDKDEICVAVRDTGPGIKKEDLPKLFHSFEQLARESQRKTGGTGLGLAISKGIIEKHHGRIWAESEPGKGATFYFTLPLKNIRMEEFKI